MRRTLLLLTLVTTAAALGALSEEEYGPDLAERYVQMEVDWVRENHDIIFDFAEQSNERVNMVSDEELAEMLRHPVTRERLGIDEVNFTLNVSDNKSEVGNETGLNASRGGTAGETSLFCFHSQALGTYVTRAHWVPDGLKFFTALWCRSAVI